MLHSRDLVWDGVLNVRDLGGHPTEDGRETRYGRIVRADNVRRLSEEGWQALADYGFRANVARVIQSVVDAPRGGVLVHCAGGKDRTGLTVAILLRLAGVGLDDIAADYALSEERLRPRHERWLAEAADDAERERLRRITATPAASMVGVLKELERRHGSVERYLLEGGAPEDIGERVRRRLT